MAHDFKIMDGGSTKSSACGRCLIAWLVISIILVVGLAIGLIVTRNHLATQTLELQVVRWCTVSPDEQTKCSALREKLLSAQVQPLVQCVARATVDSCISAVESGAADAMTTDGGHLFTFRSKLKPVMAEDYGEGDSTYWAVAVVKASDTTTSFTQAGLSGKISCHTGINKTAGWVMPVGALKTQGIISGCDVGSAVSSLFGQVCAPGGGTGLCEACSGNCQRNCDGEDYCGYSGAFRCLAERGDVAFVKHTTVSEYTDGRSSAPWAAGLTSSDYELLCTDGTRAPITAFRTCNLGKVPSHAVVVKKNSEPDMAIRVMQLLEVAQLRYGPHTTGNFLLFGGSKPDLLFKSSTQQLLPLLNTCTMEDFLGQAYLNAQATVKCSTPAIAENSRSCLLPQHVTATESTIRWCVTSDAEKTKCEAIAAAAAVPNPDVTITCLQESTVDLCAALINAGSADVTTMDGGEIYKAGANHGLQPIITEYYGGGSTPSYYAVAAIKATDTTTNFTRAGLQNKRTCHTGYQKTAGWNVPVGTMENLGILVSDGCNLPTALANLVSGSCVPGIAESGAGTNIITRLCSSCGGNCARNSSYAGYSGAYQCLQNGDGDVAFIKHTTISEADRPNYKLLCLDGSTASPADYLTCHLAQVPPHALVTSQFHSYVYRQKVWEILNGIQSTAAGKNILFSSTGGSDLIFKDSTQCLWRVPTSCQWRNFLGQEYANSVDGLQCNNAPSPNVQPCNYTPACGGK